MPKKKKPVEGVVPALVVEAPAVPDKLIRVCNKGKPFPCDLTMYGYGMRWPTNAIYGIPYSKYMELLSQGLEGVSV